MLPISLLALAACSAAERDSASEEAAEAAADVAVAAGQHLHERRRRGILPKSEPAKAGPASLGAHPEVTLSLPKMAYVFDYGFRLAADAIAPLQRKHADMCEALGPGQCQIVSLTRTGEEDDVSGDLQLAIASDRARGFAELLLGGGRARRRRGLPRRHPGRGHGQEHRRHRSADTQPHRLARPAAGSARDPQGKVEELVEAERSVAAVNQEIDQAQSWLRETRGRVAYSRMNLTYETANPGGSFLDPIEGVVGSLGAIFGMIIAALILALAVVGPFLIGGIRDQPLAPLAPAGRSLNLISYPPRRPGEDFPLDPYCKSLD